MAKSTRKIVQMVKVNENSYPMYKSIFEDQRIGSDAKLIITKALGLMNVSLNRGHTNNHFRDFYNYKDRFWYVKYPIDNIRSDTGMSNYKARKGIRELDKYGYIDKIPTFRGYVWRLPKYEQYYTRNVKQRPGRDNQRLDDPITNAPYRIKDNKNKDNKHTNYFQKQVLKWQRITSQNLNINPIALDPVVKFVNNRDIKKPLPLLHKLYYVCFIEPRNFYINPKEHYINPDFHLNKSLAVLENNANFRRNIGDSLNDHLIPIEINTKYNKKHPEKQPRTPNANDNSCMSYLVGMMKHDFGDWLKARPKAFDKVPDEHNSGDIINRNGTYEMTVPNITNENSHYEAPPF